MPLASQAHGQQAQAGTGCESKHPDNSNHTKDVPHGRNHSQQLSERFRGLYQVGFLSRNGYEEWND